ncbi:MAG: glycosyltransferase family 2 protein [Deltaproteobacteria bacterium]|nr:glycosyltransferase family 2 protein [Deltaproteobacteria bacterium]MBI5810278.1 glycosyltransferase family 2 protein [Deltaproteobacteria bacterium]
MIRISMIVVSYNTREITKQCLKSIRDNVRGVSFETICIDNGSDDGTAEMIKKEFPEVVLIESRENLGYAKGNNLGIRRSAGEYVVLLNSDTVILPGAFEGIVKYMEDHPDAGAASPKLLNPDGSIQYCVRTLPDIKTAVFQSLGWHKLFPNNRITARYYRTNLDYDKVLSVDSIGTTCYVVRREALEKVGLLDEGFFMYNVDLDFNKRIKDAGFNIYYLPGSRVMHYGGVSVNRNNVRGLIEQHQGMRLMYKKHYAAKRNILINYFIYAAIFMRLKTKLLLVFFSKDKRVIKGPGAPRK